MARRSARDSKWEYQIARLGSVMAAKVKGCYLLSVWRDAEPTLHGPYSTEKGRSRAARVIHAQQDPACDALFWLDVDARGRSEVGTYPGAFFTSCT